MSIFCQCWLPCRLLPCILQFDACILHGRDVHVTKSTLALTPVRKCREVDFTEPVKVVAPREVGDPLILDRSLVTLEPFADNKRDP